MQRQQHVDKPDYSAFLSLKIMTAAFATLCAHPLRVFLNQASVTTNPIQTIKSAYPFMLKDAHINITRGTASTGLQSITKHYAHQAFGHGDLGHMIGIGGACITGTMTATLLETPFMRRNAIRATLTNNHHALLRVNAPITTFFMARELGFCLNVFGSNDAPLTTRIPVLLGGALVTAMAQKLAAVEATKDIRGIMHSVPDYSIGYRAVFRNIAYGGVYTHEAFRVPIANPKTMIQLSTNFLYATCGPNMYFWRLAYLAAFSELLSIANKHAPDIAHRFGLFQPNQAATPGLLERPSKQLDEFARRNISK